MSYDAGYSHGRVAEYWQYVWDREDAYELGDAADPTYVLGMFPYTSGSLHMGHVRNYAITDAYARYRRMCGDDVLHPMGWDAFGLPAENAAYERYTDPQSWTEACIGRMREEMEDLGFGYDWSREVTTSDPEYYRWNQYFFRRFFEEDLVEYKSAAVNWCPDCETVLADAQVEQRRRERDHDHAGATGDEADPAADRARSTVEVCWRCGTPVGRRELDQWFLTITDYADELVDSLDDLEGWPDSVREIQRNWIGRQQGTRLAFGVEGYGDLEVFTSRLDTVHGATYVAVSPGHDLALALAEEDEDVAAYVDRARGDRGMSGVATDATARNPVTGEELPVYVAAYVLDDVGTGAVMGVPAHNERDHAFALAQDLPIETAVEPAEGEADPSGEPYTGEGVLVDSGPYDGLASATARERIRADHEAARADTTYRLRDWLISRQRYWGTPIPVVHCEECGPVLVPEAELPVELPEFVQTTGNPLEHIESFVETDCPDCGRPAERETDTMDTFVDSSWYFLRYLSPALADAPFDADLAEEWLPVDVYVGGEEHAALHLLYIRFFTRALADLGLLDRREPVERLINQGTVLHGGEKMSKSGGNVVAPHEYGPETTRLFVLSAAHPRQDFEWTAKDVSASYDLQQQVYGLVESFTERAAVRDGREPHDDYLAREIDRTVLAATEDYDRFRFHQAVTEIRALADLLGRYRSYDDPNGTVYRRGLRVLARLIAPMTPYLGEELWNMLRGDGLVVHADWPTPETAVDFAAERDLVRGLRADVREICDVAGIDDPERIEVAVAPVWKFRAHRLAREADPDDALVGRLMEAETVREHGDLAREYAESLQDRRRELEPTLDAETELAELKRAAWLLDEEFGAEVVVGRATDEKRVRKAEPGRPAVEIS